MSTPWRSPDLPADVVARLVGDAFPDLRGVEPAHLGSGFDNAAWRFDGPDGPWVFRFPRRDLAIALLDVEIAHLPALAGRLPLRIPLPERVGGPTEAFPTRFVGYRLIPGAMACDLDLDATARASLAEPLAAFLRALHTSPIPDGLPPDLIRRADLGRRAELIRQYLPGAPDLDADAVMADVDALVATPPRTDPLLVVHGDVYARHLLVDEGVPTGVIDWGDLHRGDPARDLSVSITLVPAAARSAFWAAYGRRPDPAEARRIRMHAWLYAVVLRAYGRDVGDDGLRRASDWALDGLRTPLW